MKSLLVQKRGLARGSVWKCWFHTGLSRRELARTIQAKSRHGAPITARGSPILGTASPHIRGTWHQSPSFEWHLRQAGMSNGRDKPRTTNRVPPFAQTAEMEARDQSLIPACTPLLKRGAFCYTAPLRGFDGMSPGTSGRFGPINNPQAVTGNCVGTKKTGKGRRKLGRKKRRMRSKIRHRKG